MIVKKRVDQLSRGDVLVYDKGPRGEAAPIRKYRVGRVLPSTKPAHFTITQIELASGKESEFTRDGSCELNVELGEPNIVSKEATLVEPGDVIHILPLPPMPALVDALKNVALDPGPTRLLVLRTTPITPHGEVELTCFDPVGPGPIGANLSTRFFRGVVGVEAPELTPAQVYADELLVLIGHAVQPGTVSAAWRSQALELIAKIVPPAPPTLEEALTALAAVRSSGATGMGVVNGQVVDDILDRARKSGVLK
jgi:hypothetical protein